MFHYKIVAATEKIRRLCGVAGSVASMKLEIGPPDFQYIQEVQEEDPQATIETARRIRGQTGPDARGDVWVMLNVDQTPERLVSTVFHEVYHLRIFKGYLEGNRPISTECNEGAAEFFAATETGKGDYNELFAQLCHDGAEAALGADLPKTAGALADMLAPYMPRTARELKERAYALVKLNAELEKIDAGWESPSATATRYAANNSEYQKELAAQRRRQSFERELARLSGHAAKIVRDAKEQAAPYQAIRTKIKVGGKWIDSGEIHWVPRV
jgi:hypothetical protein